MRRGRLESGGEAVTVGVHATRLAPTLSGPQGVGQCGVALFDGEGGLIGA